jgi:glucose/arabinose dehydrogenase
MRLIAPTLALTCAITAALVGLVAAQPRPDAVARKYTELCANCHGPNLQGAQFGSLVDDEWKFGSDDASLTKSIREGNPQAGMPPMGGALTENEIRAMVIYIREQGARFKREKTTFSKPAPNVTVKSEKHPFKLETVVEGVTFPWGVDFLPDGRMLVTEKAGQLRIVEKGQLLPAPVAGTPPVIANGQGGLLDVGVHPDYATNGWIYLSYSDKGGDGSAMTRVVRGKLKEGNWVEQETLFQAPIESYRKGGNHFGTRFVFNGKGQVFFSIGERGHQADAQELTRPNGKVHRINEDGTIPADNPFAGQAGAVKSIFSYGNRNPQGLAQHPETGELWEVEHGPRGGDELNVIRSGRNYGWPVITYGMNYDGTPMTSLTANEGMEQPVTYWTPSLGIGAIAFYRGDKFPDWKNQIFITALAYEEVRRLVVEGGKVTHQEVLFKGVGRVRDIVSGPDGYLYLVMNQPDRIARIVPADSTTSSK